MEEIMSEFNGGKVNTFPRYLVIGSVPILLFILLLLGFNQFIPLKVEIHSIIIIFLILLIFLFFIPHNAWYSFSIFKKRLEDSKENIDNFLASKELKLNGKTKSYASLDEYLKNSSKNLRNDNFANIASSIFPTLGILGTFTAIAISMPNFTVDSKQALENEITLLLSGVGTAFYASIFGIFLSIWWIFFEKRGLTKIENEIIFIKDTFKDKIWTKEEIEIATIIEKQKDSLPEKIENLLTPDYLFRLDAIIKEKLNQLEEINKTFLGIENKISESYMNFSSMFDKTAVQQEKLIENFENIQGSIEKINESFKESLSNQKINQKAVKAETYSALTSLQMVSSDLKELGKDLINAK
jgi:hypothetical protein